MPSKIRVENLTKVFGPLPEQACLQLETGASKDTVYRDTSSVVAVANVSFSVPQGQIFVVMGLSGSGKSTLIRCLNRLIEPTFGRIYLDEEDILAANSKRLRELRRTKMAMVFQHFALFPHMTVGENVEYGLKVRGIDKTTRRQQALTALAQVGLREWADTPPHNLSGGMQQRVGLARGLAADPEVLLMDEPFSALDPLIRRDMQQELLNLQHRLHKTIVFITHDLHEALILGDQIAIMKDGRFVQVGSAQDIVGSPADPYVATFTQDVDRSRVFTLGNIMEKAATLKLEQDSTTAALTRLRQAPCEDLYVTNSQGKPVGLLAAGDIDPANPQNLAAALRRQFPKASASTPLVDAYRLCAEGLPIAVVDDSGQLCGTVQPLQVFKELAVGAQEQAPADNNHRSSAADALNESALQA
jgi:glycine betaine/proline transport system ATP-binding protein